MRAMKTTISSPSAERILGSSWTERRRKTRTTVTRPSQSRGQVWTRVTCEYTEVLPKCENNCILFPSGWTGCPGLAGAEHSYALLGGSRSSFPSQFTSTLQLAQRLVRLPSCCSLGGWISTTWCRSGDPLPVDHLSGVADRNCSQGETKAHEFGCRHIQMRLLS